jgi:hypothetical protein
MKSLLFSGGAALNVVREGGLGIVVIINKMLNESIFLTIFLSHFLNPFRN